jgi:carbon-monoxide dehydrogenase medium subunit
MIKYEKPKSIDEALHLYADENSYFLAGGTDLGVYMADCIVRPRILIDVTGIEELNKIEMRDDELVIGAAVSLSELAQSSLVPSCLREGARAIGSPQIRNLGTLGGNICNASPCGDTLAPLLALDATFKLSSRDGERNISAEDFFTGPKKTVRKQGEILKHVSLPKEALSGVSGFRMIGKRRAQAISQINCALWMQMTGAEIQKIRVAAGSVAPVPYRLEETASYFSTTPRASLSRSEVSRIVAQEIAPIDDVRSTKAYRNTVTGSLIWEIWEELLAQAKEGR